MNGMLEGKVAVVVGGTGELGAGISATLAAHGADVAVVHDGTTAVKARGAAARGASRVWELDVEQAEEASTEALVGAISSELGPIDVLIYNARHRVVGDFLSASLEELRRTIAVDARGALLLSQAVARRQVARGVIGRLVIVSSSASLRAVPLTCLHALAGSMATTLAQVAAVELAPHGVTVNVVAAGWFESGFLECADAELALAAIPAGRLGRPDELGEVCAFLASDASAYVSGAVIPVDGAYAVTKSPGGSPIRCAAGDSTARATAEPASIRVQTSTDGHDGGPSGC